MPASARLLFFPRHADVVRHRERIGDWTLETARNRFSGTIVCRLRASGHRAFFEGGAVAFRFKARWDVNAAVYRLDSAEPHRFADDMPTLMSLNVPLDRGGMDNATGGLVWIPYDRLIGANRVAIQPRTNRAPTEFHFRGLRALHDIALEKGCSPDGDFVE